MNILKINVKLLKHLVFFHLLQKKTNLSLNKVNFCEQTLLKYIRKLNINKAHGHDEISVRMIKLEINLLLNPCLLFTKIVLLKDTIQKYGKWLLLSLVTKKMKEM